MSGCGISSKKMYAILVATILSSAFGHPTTYHEKECMKEIQDIYAALEIPPEEEHNYKAIIAEIKKRINPEICSHVHLKFGIANGKIVVYNPDDVNNEGPEENQEPESNPGEESELHRNGRRAPPHRHYFINNNSPVVNSQSPYPDYPKPPNNHKGGPYDKENNQVPTNYQNRSQDGDNVDAPSYNNPQELNNEKPVENPALPEQNDAAETPPLAELPDNQAGDNSQNVIPTPNNVGNNNPIPPISKPIQQPSLEPVRRLENIPTDNNVIPVNSGVQAPIAPSIDNDIPKTDAKTDKHNEAADHALQYIDKANILQEEKARQLAAERFWAFANKVFTPINKCSDNQTPCDDESYFSIFNKVVERYFDKCFELFTTFITSGVLTPFITSLFSLGGIPSGISSGITSGIPSGVLTSGVPSGIPTSGVPSGIPSGVPTSGVPSGIPTGIPSLIPPGFPTSGLSAATAAAGR